jgi:hypothetical protein
MSNFKNTPSDQEQELLATQVRRYLKPLKDELPEVSPYLKTRVLARVRETAPTRSYGLSFRLAFGSLMSLALMVSGASYINRITHRVSAPNFVAMAQKPTVVKMDLKDLKLGASHAKVELSDGVHFYSHKFPELRNKNQLDIDWTNQATPDSLPIVVRSEAGGNQFVRVKFFNDQDQLVSERVLKIQFQAVGDIEGVIEEVVGKKV